MKLYRSARGDIKSEFQWRNELNSLWFELNRVDDFKRVPRPSDAWDRLVRVLGLEEVELNTSNSFEGVF